jgi:hydroxyethylthiazole kinase-like uncharacterized protein yjeF
LCSPTGYLDYMLEKLSTPGPEILSVGEMIRAEQLAIGTGFTSLSLMEKAGNAVAEHIHNQWSPRETLVLCGPGNNGGDGFVTAAALAQRGWPVRVCCLVDSSSLFGDAKEVSATWLGDVSPMGPEMISGAEIIIDAIFGAGLSRPISGVALKTLETANRSGKPIVAVDLPSGIDGDTGELMGFAASCHSTVTFFRPKRGHLLMPARRYIGETIVKDIGIPEEVLEEISPKTFVNQPEYWEFEIPWPNLSTHKFARGHLVVVGSDKMTGATRLAARAAMRIGAGLVTVLSPPSAVPIYSLDDPVLIVQPLREDFNLSRDIDDKRKNTALIGPGATIGEPTKFMLGQFMAENVTTVIDGGALSSFEDKPDELFEMTRGNKAVMTPHEGEFSRLFNFKGDKITQAAKAAVLSGVVVLLKGADSVIASPDGRICLNNNGPSWLATAGSGDVLAGAIAGLIAMGLPEFEATCVAVWVHGAAGSEFGPGLIASDLPELFPKVLTDLYCLR